MNEETQPDQQETEAGTSQAGAAPVTETRDEEMEDLRMKNPFSGFFSPIRQSLAVSLRLHPAE